MEFKEKIKDDTNYQTIKQNDKLFQYFNSLLQKCKSSSSEKKLLFASFIDLEVFNLRNMSEKNDEEKQIIAVWQAPTSKFLGLKELADVADRQELTVEHEEIETIEINNKLITRKTFFKANEVKKFCSLLFKGNNCITELLFFKDTRYCWWCSEWELLREQRKDYLTRLSLTKYIIIPFFLITEFYKNMKDSQDMDLDIFQR